MEYTIICNGKSYDLPKKTLKVAEEIEKAIALDATSAPLKEKYKTVLKVCQVIIGQEAAEEILGTNKLEEMDLGEITILFEKIVDAYQAPIVDYKTDRNSEQIAKLPLADLEKIGNALASIPK